VAPFVATWLAASYGVAWVGLYLSVSALVTLMAVVTMRETKDRPLDTENLTALAATTAAKS